MKPDLELAAKKGINSIEMCLLSNLQYSVSYLPLCIKTLFHTYLSSAVGVGAVSAVVAARDATGARAAGDTAAGAQATVRAFSADTVAGEEAWGSGSSGEANNGGHDESSELHVDGGGGEFETGYVVIGVRSEDIEVG